jgi:hypothetical protein
MTQSEQTGAGALHMSASDPKRTNTLTQQERPLAGAVHQGIAG